MKATRKITLTRDNGEVRNYDIGEDIDHQDRSHWFAHGVHPNDLDKIPAAGSVQADPKDLAKADKADGPARDPTDVPPKAGTGGADPFTAQQRKLDAAAVYDPAKATPPKPKADKGAHKAP